MTEYDNTNSGALFRNDRKESDRHPDYQGSLNVGGVDYWISSWVKTKRDGGKFMSLSVKPKDSARSSSSRREESARPDLGDESIPF